MGIGDRYDVHTPNNGFDDENSDDGFYISSNPDNPRVYNLVNGVTGDGYLQAWIDIDKSGTFDSDENFFTNAVQLTTNPAGMNIDITNDALVDVILQSASGLYDIRVRYASAESDVQNPIGIAADGEVEDYCVQLIYSQSSMASVAVACDLL